MRFSAPFQAALWRIIPLNSFVFLSLAFSDPILLLYPYRPCLIKPFFLFAIYEHSFCDGLEGFAVWDAFSQLRIIIDTIENERSLHVLLDLTHLKSFFLLQEVAFVACNMVFMILEHVDHLRLSALLHDTRALNDSCNFFLDALLLLRV